MIFEDPGTVPILCLLQVSDFADILEQASKDRQASYVFG